MKLHYATKTYGWRWVIILTRLHSIDGEVLKVSPAKDTSIHTARAKLFHGRSYVIESAEDSLLYRYAEPSIKTSIHTEAGCLKIHKLDGFGAQMADMKLDGFCLTLQQITAELCKNSGTVFFPSFPATLDKHQIAALTDYLSHLSNVVTCNIGPTGGMVVRR